MDSTLTTFSIQTTISTKLNNQGRIRRLACNIVFSKSLGKTLRRPHIRTHTPEHTRPTVTASTTTTTSATTSPNQSPAAVAPQSTRTRTRTHTHTHAHTLHQDQARPDHTDNSNVSNDNTNLVQQYLHSQAYDTNNCCLTSATHEQDNRETRAGETRERRQR